MYFSLFIIFYSLSSHPDPSRPLFFIVLHDDLKKHSREKALTCDVTSEQIIVGAAAVIPNQAKKFFAKGATTFISGTSILLNNEPTNLPD